VRFDNIWFAGGDLAEQLACIIMVDGGRLVVDGLTLRLLVLWLLVIVELNDVSLHVDLYNYQVNGDKDN